MDCSRLLCFLRFKPQAIHKAFALTGRFVDCYYTQGVALGYELLPFQGVLLMSIALGYVLLPFQGVLLMSIALGYELLPFQGVLLMSIALGYPLPWAMSFCPLPLLSLSASDFQFRYAPVTVGSGRAACLLCKP
nr:hypothetical protein [uncultured Prevotella sp.]